MRSGGATSNAAEGTAIVTENVFDNRLGFVPELNRMGADIRHEGRHAVVRGVPRLSGAPVRAVHGGTVAYAAPFTGYGVMVILDHGQDAFTVYGHLSGTALRPGTTVARGQLVGTAGATPAGETAAYFEVRIDGLQAIFEIRMRREESLDAGREQHVRDFFRFRIADPRTGRHRADLHERAAQAARIARELHGRRIRQAFTLA